MGRQFYLGKRRNAEWSDPALKDRIHRAQGKLCAGCGFSVQGEWWWQPDKAGEMTMDHVIPRAAKGGLGLGNLVVMHRRCNEEKADRMPTGCELIWLMAVNAVIGAEPTRW